MKKVLISTVAVASVVLFSSCSVPFQKHEEKVNAMMPAENSMMKDDSAMMEKSWDAMMQMPTGWDAMMKAEVKASGSMMKK